MLDRDKHGGTTAQKQNSSQPNHDLKVGPDLEGRSHLPYRQETEGKVVDSGFSRPGRRSGLDRKSNTIQRWPNDDLSSSQFP